MQDDRLGGNPLLLLVIALTGLAYVTVPRARGTTEAESSAARELAPVASSDVEEAVGEVRSLVVDEGFGLGFLVALVPDPEPSATEVGWLFDGQADAIQRAAESAGYLLLRRALPSDWLPDTDSGGHADTGPEDPGVLVFRRKDGNPEVLVVFLVGESPTRGVDPDEFDRAFTLLDGMHDAPEQLRPKAHTRILGPAFSGSAWSLRRAIERQMKTHPGRVEIISGTATDASVRDTLVRGWRQPVRLTYRATVIPDQAAIDALYDHLERLGADISKIAMLVEATTAYGDSMFLSAFHRRDQPSHEASTDHRVAAPRLVFQFPLHIAQARAAYDRTRPARGRAAPDTFQARISQLELSFDDGEQPFSKDVLPPLYPRMTGFDVDLVLSNILGSMAREDVHYVAIFATDPRDKLFLARKIREYLPDVRILTTEANLLYTHPDYRAYLDGAIVATTYPLFAKNQLWVLPSRVGDYFEQARKSGATFTHTTRVTQFSDSASEGVYNAALALLGKKGLMKDYGAPCFDAQCPEHLDRPPVWITAVGHGMMWPLEGRWQYDDGGIVERGPASVSPDPRGSDIAGGIGHTRSAASILFLASVFAMANGVAVWRFWRPGRDGAAGVPWRSLAPLAPSTTQPKVQRLWIVLLLLVVAAGQTLLLGLVTIFVRSNWEAGVPAEGALRHSLLAVVATSLGWVAVLLAIARVAGRKAGSCLLGMCLLVTGIFLGKTWNAFPTNAFFYLRATNLGSGLSPIPPIVFIGAVLYLCCYHHLHRIHLLGTLSLPNPLAADGVPGGEWLASQEQSVRRRAENGLWTVPLRLVVPVAVIGMLAWWSLADSMLPGFDSYACDRVLFWGITLAYVAVLSAAVRFAWSWWGLRALLQQLDHHPLTGAFSRIPEELHELLRRRYYAYVPGPSERLRTARMWLGLDRRFRGEAVGRSEPDLPSSRPETVAWAADDVAAFFNEEEAETDRLGRVPLGAESSVQRFLSQRAGSVARAILTPTPTAEDKQPEVARSADVEVERAEEFVAVEVVTSLCQKFVQLGNLVTFMIAGLLLTNFAFASYPFQPQRLITIFLLTLATSVILVLLVALFQADRDPLLSRMAGVKPGRITLDRGLVGQVLTYAVVPLVTVVATQFPTTGSAFDPLFKLLK